MLLSSSVAEESTTLKLHSADWEAFQECRESLTISQLKGDEGVDVHVALFTTNLNKVAEKSIAKTLTVPKKVNKPRFEDDCKKAIDYAKDRRTISEAKCQS